MAETGQQINVGGPWADAVHGGERRVRLLGGKPTQRGERQLAARDGGPPPPPPPATARAIALSARIFGADSPSRASRAGRARRMAAGSNGSKAAASRAQMAPALAVESCCATIMAASAANPSARRRSGGRPAVARSATKRGSAFPSPLSAASRSASV
jgi:hypothetical protein